MESEARILHPAYTVAAKVARAWSDSDRQAFVRASQIVTALARVGMVVDVKEIGAEFAYKADA